VSEYTRWRYDDDAPMFAARDVMDRAKAAFDIEYAESVARGEHYFMALVGFRIDIDGDQILTTNLGQDTLRSPPSIGCYICGEPWQPGMDARCPGEPDD
jgi:hypothetical protein